MEYSYECSDLMSGEQSGQKQNLQPRKKKKSKRKATSPLIDTEQRDQASEQFNGLNGHVSNANSAFYFPNPQNQNLMMNFSQQGAFGQGTPMYGSGPGPGSYPAPSQSPTQMTSFGVPPAPPNPPVGPPSWATELMSEMKQIKHKLCKLDEIEKTVNMINLKVSDLETKVHTIDTRVITVEQSCSFMGSENDDRKNELKSAKTEVTSLKSRCETLESNNKSYMEQCAKLGSKVADLESRSMRDNLLFYGVPEGGDAENCELLIKTVMSEKLNVTDTQSIVLDRVHRVGSASHNKVRPIVAKFHYYKQRELVRQASYARAEELKNHNLGVGIQWPQQIRDARKALYPIMQQAKNNGRTVKLVKDKLFIDGVEYKPGPATGQQQQQHS